VWSAIRFLKAKNVHPAETHTWILEVFYGGGAMNEGDVRKWSRLLK